MSAIPAISLPLPVHPKVSQFGVGLSQAGETRSPPHIRIVTTFDPSSSSSNPRSSAPIRGNKSPVSVASSASFAVNGPFFVFPRSSGPA
jgi:hypothetical protein